MTDTFEGEISPERRTLGIGRVLLAFVIAFEIISTVSSLAAMG